MKLHLLLKCLPQFCEIFQTSNTIITINRKPSIVFKIKNIFLPYLSRE